MFECGECKKQLPDDDCIICHECRQHFHYRCCGTTATAYKKIKTPDQRRCLKCKKARPSRCIDLTKSNQISVNGTSGAANSENSKPSQHDGQNRHLIKRDHYTFSVVFGHLNLEKKIERNISPSSPKAENVITDNCPQDDTDTVLKLTSSPENCKSSSFPVNCKLRSFSENYKSSSFPVNCKSTSSSENCKSSSFSANFKSSSYSENLKPTSFPGNCKSTSVSDNRKSTSVSENCKLTKSSDNCKFTNLSDNYKQRSFSENCKSTSFSKNCNSNIKTRSNNEDLRKEATRLAIFNDESKNITCTRQFGGRPSSELLSDQESISSYGTNSSTSVSDSIISKSISQQHIPFFNNITGSNDDHISALSKLLNNTVEDQQCLKEEHVMKIVNDVKYVLYRNFQNCWVKLYGSYRTGFTVSNSNLNLELITEGANIGMSFYNSLAKRIEEEKPDYYVRVEECLVSKTPGIVLIEPELGTNCNIIYIGKGSSHYRFSELMYNISSLDSRIKILVIALRHWAEVCSIHNADVGRLPSVAFAMLVIHFLQRTSQRVLLPVNSYTVPQLPEDRNKDAVGKLWLDLMRYYSEEFNWRDDVICITKPGNVPKNGHSWAQCWIGIESPIDSKVNIAKSVRSQDVSQYIQLCFKQSFKYYQNPPNKELLDEWDETQSDSGYGHMMEGEYEYTFDSSKLTEGITMPTLCPECDELGYTCPDCLEDEDDDEYEPPSYQPISVKPQFLESINEALIEAYEEHVIQDSDKTYRVDFVSNLENYVKKKFPDSSLRLVGSSMNGFGFRNSDLDICLTFDNKSLDNIDTKKTIRELCIHLRKNRDFSSVVAIYSAKIPLVQFVHYSTGMRGDISLYNLLAVENTKLLRHYSKIDQRARILGCAMKLLAKNACIADTARRTLSSYSYILIVIYFLQQTEPPVLPVLQELIDESPPPQQIVENCDVWFQKDINKAKTSLKKENTKLAADLWLELLKFYTEDFDSSRVINIKHKEVQKSNCHSARLFNIQDPFIEEKNLGCVISADMSKVTWRTLLRARKLFGTSIEQPPSGFKSFKEYLFHPMSLTDGRIMKATECTLCGKLGHAQKDCVRYNYIPTWCKPSIKAPYCQKLASPKHNIDSNAFAKIPITSGSKPIRPLRSVCSNVY